MILRISLFPNNFSREPFTSPFKDVFLTHGVVGMRQGEIDSRVQLNHCIDQFFASGPPGVSDVRNELYLQIPAKGKGSGSGVIFVKWARLNDVFTFDIGEQ